MLIRPGQQVATIRRRGATTILRPIEGAARQCCATVLWASSESAPSLGFDVGRRGSSNNNNKWSL